MRPDEKPLDYFFRMLVEKKLSLIDLLRLYVRHLELAEEKNRKQIVESAILLAMYDEPKLNQGTKKQLKDRTKVAIQEAEIFDKEKMK